MKIYKDCPSILIIFTNKDSELIEYFKSKYNVLANKKIINKENKRFDKIFSSANEKSTIVLLADNLSDFVKVSDIKRIMIINREISNLLLDLVNSDLDNLIEKVRKGPELLTIKNYADIDNFCEILKKNFNGYSGDLFDLLELNNSGTILSLTNSNINKKIKIDELYEKSIYTSMGKNELINILDINSIKYINDSLGSRHWNEYKIKIYDAYEQYNYHYNRLLFLIDKLNLGLVLKEGWGEDAGTIFNIVQVYELFLYTTLEPKEIKKILVGAEYLDNGERFIDLDLFYNRKKIKWSSLRDKELFKKEEIGLKCRKEMISMLREGEYKNLISIEEKIIEEKDNY